MSKFFEDVNEIRNFSGEYRFLSNFSTSHIRWNNKWWRSVEHLYQASKFPHDPQFQEEIRCARTPGEAKRIAHRRDDIRADWDDIKVDVMRSLLEKKFKNDSHRKEQLLSTGNAYLVEGNTWGDTFWGVCDGKGKNMLGRLLMEIREKLQQQRENHT